MKINQEQINLIKIALLEAIQTYNNMIDAYAHMEINDDGHFVLIVNINELDKDTRVQILAWRVLIKKFKKLYEDMGA